MSHQFKYCPSLTNYIRRKSRVVDIGGVPLGGGYPIRIQSMTIAPTMNTAESIAESIRIIESGGEYVRLTAPSIREAENLKNIRDGLRKQGYKQPLIADIHFTPNAAIAAAKIVEKVRINPGNYADRKKFQVKEYTDETYKAELERIYERFSPLVKVCKEHGTAMRIGTNHGSLSDRILNRYGDTPLGMVESALEFIRICEDHTYYDIVLSMKASNPLVMVEAYRLLVNRMDAENMNYPLHLGVTEAGEGEDARIKSAMGIGALLEDGLGDTIRVSLTEPPEFESPVARRIVNRYHNRSNNNVPKKPEISSPVNPFVYNRRETYAADTIGGSEVPRVIVDFQNINPGYEDFKIIGYDYAVDIDKWNMSETAADFVYLGTNETSINLPPSLSKIFDYGHWSGIKNNKSTFPLYKGEEYLTAEKKSERINFVIVSV
ncbi:(E)-4-hydroxy-3-methylbut-2-enyl-diphosphate synthase, partial [candidate division KSB1 bacterium]|nr:(E)-4-hydroxy-3-methylbut-2-enyl-diphosphate synthase [candidate division KSB1 bacterium]